MPRLTIKDATAIIKARIISRVGPEALQEMTKEELASLVRFALKQGIPAKNLD